MSFETQIDAWCGHFLKANGLSAHHVHPIGSGFLEYTLIEFRNDKGEELRAVIEIPDDSPELKDGSLRTYDIAYEFTADGSQFEIFSNFASRDFDAGKDLGEQLVDFLNENIEKTRRISTGLVHRNKTFYRACIAVDELRDELGLQTETSMKGHTRSELSVTDGNGRQCQLYMSAGRLQFKLADEDATSIHFPGQNDVGGAVRQAITSAFPVQKNGLGK
jgi:hypothetical protein